jgi:hypothetical protein
MTSLVFRIRKRYFDAIVSGEKRVEYRRASQFWRKRIVGKGETLDTAVFVCGKQVHRRKITEIEQIKTPSWFSEQGQKDVDTPTCFAIYLGSVVSKNSREERPR